VEEMLDQARELIPDFRACKNLSEEEIIEIRDEANFDFVADYTEIRPLALTSDEISGRIEEQVIIFYILISEKYILSEDEFFDLNDEKTLNMLLAFKQIFNLSSDEDLNSLSFADIVEITKDMIFTKKAV